MGHRGRQYLARPDRLVDGPLGPFRAQQNPAIRAAAVSAPQPPCFVAPGELACGSTRRNRYRAPVHIGPLLPHFPQKIVESIETIVYDECRQSP